MKVLLGIKKVTTSYAAIDIEVASVVEAMRYLDDISINEEKLNLLNATEFKQEESVEYEVDSVGPVLKVLDVGPVV